MTDETPETFDTPEAEIASIQETIRTDPAAYHGSQDMQARLAELVTERDVAAEEQAGRKPSPLEAEQAKELDEIREIMRTDPQRYWKDKGMQAKLAQLSMGPEPEPDNFLGLRDFEFAQADIMGDERLVDVFKGPNGEQLAETYYERAADLFNVEAGEVDPLEAMELRDTFTGLDSEMSPALARWITSMPEADATQAVDIEVAREPFLTTEEGQTLHRIWGDDFDANFSKYLARVNALRASMPEHVFARFLEKFDALSPGAARAVIEWMVRQK